MIYRPERVREIWDTWLFYEAGVHYLFTLHKSAGDVWDGISLSTSSDGVHFQEIGVIIEKRPDAEWLGTGSTWKIGDTYYLNFSESRDGVQGIYFAESSDLITWRIMEGNACHPDPRWYDITPNGRWDCIWTVPLEGGGYVGYLTAVPLTNEPGRAGASVGKVESEDGIHWRAAEPPAFHWGDMPPIDLYEVGAVEWFDGYYHMMIGMGEDRLGNRQLWQEVGGQFGMYHFASEDPNGPFYPVKEDFRLLCSPNMMTYFSRFYPHPEGMLICHHSCEKTDRDNHIYLSPIKRARTDGRAMALYWWKGNEALLGSKSAADIGAISFLYRARGVAFQRDETCLLMEDNVGGAAVKFAERFDPELGAALSFRFRVTPRAGRMGAVGVWCGHGAERTAFLMETRGRTAIGPLSIDGSFLARQVVASGCVAQVWQRALVLMRRSLIELYLDDRLIQCYSLPRAMDGSFGLVLESAETQVCDVEYAQMTL